MRKTNANKVSSGKKKVASLKSFWDGVEDTFKSKVKGIRALLRNQASGAAIEEYFRELLCSYLPRRYIVEPGFVVTETGEMSNYIDLLVVDALHIPPLCNDPPVRIFAAEAIVAAIEITSAPLGKVKRANLGMIPKLQDDVLKLARVRGLTEVRKYSDVSPFPISAGSNKLALRPSEFRITLSCRSVIITCGEEGSRKKYEETLLASLQTANQIREHVWLHLAYSLKHGLYRFHAYTNFEHRHIEKNALLDFLLCLNDLLSSYDTYRTNIYRYRPSLRKEGEGDELV